MDRDAKIFVFIAVSVIGLLLCSFVGCQSYQVVPPGERGLSVTMGKIYPQAIGEGFTLKKPFIESITLVNIKQVAMPGMASCFSSDLQTVNINYVCMYRVPESRVVEIFQQYGGDPYASLIEPRLQEAIKQVTAGYAAEALVKSREEIREKALARARLSVGEILNVVDLNIANIDLTKELEKAIELKMVQAQQALAKQYELDKAKKDAEITVVSAKAEAESVKIKGEALASSPKVIELEIVKRWDGKSPTTLVVGQGGGANVVFPVGK